MAQTLAIVVIVWLIAMLGAGGGAAAFAVFVIVVLVVVALLNAMSRRDKEASLQGEASSNWADALSLSGISSSHELRGGDGLSAIAVDEPGAKLLLATLRPRLVFDVYGFRDLISVELVEDGDTLTSAVRSSQVAGAVVGGLLLGSAGALVGGLTGKTKTTKTVRSVEIRLKVNNLDRPVLSVVLLNLEMGRDDPRYKHVSEVATHWAGLLSAVIRRADARADAPRHVQGRTVAEELVQLAGLRDSGVLTEHEFLQQKSRALAR